MAGPDNVDIGASGIDIGRFVKSRSNRPGGNIATGLLHEAEPAREIVAGWNARGTAFKTVDRKRTLVAGPKFEVEAGLDLQEQLR